MKLHAPMSAMVPAVSLIDAVSETAPVGVAEGRKAQALTWPEPRLPGVQVQLIL